MSTLSDTSTASLSSAANFTRRLLYFPILHTQADLGKLGAQVKQTMMDKWGKPAWGLNNQIIEQMWLDIEKSIDYLSLPYAKTRVYQDGLPVCGYELAIVTELATAGSHNHRLLLQLHKAGATIIGTEAPELLLEEYQLLIQTLQNAPTLDITASQTQLGQSLLKRRDKYIAQRINQTLDNGETGVLFLGMLHSVQEFLNTDIEVIFPIGKPKL